MGKVLVCIGMCMIESICWLGWINFSCFLSVITQNRNIIDHIIVLWWIMVSKWSIMTEHDRSGSHWLNSKSSWKQYSANNDISRIAWLTVSYVSLPSITIYYLPLLSIPFHSRLFPSVPFCYFSQHSNQPIMSIMSKYVWSCVVAYIYHRNIQGDKLISCAPTTQKLIHIYVSNWYHKCIRRR